jgi:hypothetical protein
MVFGDDVKENRFRKMRAIMKMSKTKPRKIMDINTPVLCVTANCSNP